MAEGEGGVKECSWRAFDSLSSTQFLGNTINGTSNNGTFDINLSKESKNRKKGQEDEEEDEGVGS